MPSRGGQVAISAYQRSTHHLLPTGDQALLRAPWKRGGGPSGSGVGERRGCRDFGSGAHSVVASLERSHRLKARVVRRGIVLTAAVVRAGVLNAGLIGVAGSYG
jgi:hypothetical protein